VGAAPLANLGKNRLKHGFGVLQNLVIPETQDMEAAVLQPRIAHPVIGAPVVLSAIGFDGHTRAAMREIDDIRADGVLAAEFLAA
jgi:hypothetical protein